MKRLILIVLLFSVICLTGCTNSNDLLLLAKNDYSQQASVTIKINDEIVYDGLIPAYYDDSLDIDYHYNDEPYTVHATMLTSDDYQTKTKQLDKQVCLIGISSFGTLTIH
jgi:hypothetical protein